ncbi:MAG: SpoIIE family protein phosphatase [Clostridia bacterium]|nr:SpoIIE family protein phosphatase [Clostridia bacterium]
MKKRVIHTIIVHTLTSAFMIIACNASVFGAMPFGFSAHLAVLLCKGLPLASVYFLCASMLVSPTLYAFCVSASLAVVGVVTNVIIAFAPIERKKLWRCLANPTLQSATYGILIYLFGTPRINVIISVLVGVAVGFLLSFAYPSLSDIRQRIGTLSNAGLGVFLVIFFMGVTPIKIAEFPLVTLVFIIFILCSTFCHANALTVGALATVGITLATGEPLTAIVGLCASLIARAFSGGYRLVTATAVALAYFSARCLFSSLVGVEMEMIAVGVGVILFLIIPNKVRKGLGDYFKPMERPLAVVTASGMGRKLPERLLRASEALGEMSELLAFDEKKESGLSKAVLTALSQVCDKCTRQNDCVIAEALPMLSHDFATGGSMLKNKVINEPCINGGRFMLVANRVREESAETIKRAEEERRSASSYAERLSSLRKLIGDIAIGVREDYRYDPDLSEKIRQNLPEWGIPCVGALTTHELCGVVLAPADTDIKRLTKAVSKTIGRIKIDRAEEVTATYAAFAFSSAPALDVVYGIATLPKAGNTQNGDSYSATLCDSRAFLSLCDGVGTGKNASKLSQATLSIIESHYKAGFDVKDCITSVNAFLSARPGEEFSAIDIINLDLNTGETDVIKAGSPPTYIIHGDSLTKIDGTALPIGALDVPSYAFTQKKLTVGDLVILTTDGVSDALPDLPEVIVAETRLNVQAMADRLLAQARARSDRDDMSVLVARIIPSEKIA